MKKKVIVRAPLLTISGYGVHSRQLFEWALSREDFEVSAQCLPWGVTPWLINKDDKDGLVGQIMARSVDPTQQSKFDISFQIQLPNEWDPNIAQFNVGVTAAVETDRCHPSWIQNCNTMDLVIVPSQHTKNVLISSGQLTTPVVVVSESYYNVIDSPDLEPLDVDFQTDFNFLVFGQFTGNNPENDRKNLFYTVKWLCEEFADNENVGIVLKVNSGRATKIDKAVTSKTLTQLLHQVRGDRKGPKIYLLHGNLSEEEIARLYLHPKIKAMVSLTRGEGFGLPLLEAAASGLPVIATNWSGHMDFLGLGKFIGVEHVLSPIHPSRIDHQIFVEGSRWASVSEKDAKKKVRKFYEKSEIPTKWAKDLQGKIKERFSHSAITSSYNEAMKEFV
ncbi:hypothetical protein CMK19_01225 [Candidatus Poribacteria bacterium]|nr:hypothetical protein [Candidatus Poribacteria bacterium]